MYAAMEREDRLYLTPHKNVRIVVGYRRPLRWGSLDSGIQWVQRACNEGWDSRVLSSKFSISTNRRKQRSSSKKVCGTRPSRNSRYHFHFGAIFLHALIRFELVTESGSFIRRKVLGHAHYTSVNLYVHLS